MKKEIIKLLGCPHCGGLAILKLESKLYTKSVGKKLQYARIYCENNNPHDHKNRCYCKTVAAPIDKVVEHWNKRTSCSTYKNTGAMK